MSAITTGGREKAYQNDGYNRYTIRQLLAPIEQTAYLCGMDYLPPFVVHGTHGMTFNEIKLAAKSYQTIIIAIRDNLIDWQKAKQLPRINSDFSSILLNQTEVKHAR